MESTKSNKNLDALSHLSKMETRKSLEDMGMDKDSFRCNCKQLWAEVASLNLIQTHWFLNCRAPKKDRQKAPTGNWALIFVVVGIFQATKYFSAAKISSIYFHMPPKQFYTYRPLPKFIDTRPLYQGSFESTSNDPTEYVIFLHFKHMYD